MKTEYETSVKLITQNRYSRPGRRLKGMRGLVVHWVANPGSTPRGNRNFFENRKLGKDDFGSAHEIIGITGERLICIPEAELAYHVGSKKYTRRALSRLSSYPNDYTYGIEMCHQDWTGEFTEETLDSAAQRCAELCMKYDLDPIRDIWTHQQVVGWKECPRWFVKKPLEFQKFKERVKEIMMPEKLEKWQKELGRKAVKELAERGILNDPAKWNEEDELAKPAPTWLMLTVLARYAEEDEKNEKTIKGLMVILVVILLGVLMLGIQGVIPMPMAMNVVAAGVFIGVLLVLTYMGQVEVVKKILLSLVIEAEQIYGSGTGKMKYNYVLGKAYSMIPSVVKLFVTEQAISEMLETSVDYLQELLEEKKLE